MLDRQQQIRIAAGLISGNGSFTCDFDVLEHMKFNMGSNTEIKICAEDINEEGKFDAFTFCDENVGVLTINAFSELKSWENLPTKMLGNKISGVISMFKLYDIKNIDILNGVKLQAEAIMLSASSTKSSLISLRGLNLECDSLTLSSPLAKHPEFTNIFNLFQCERVTNISPVISNFPEWFKLFVNFFNQNGGSSGSPYDAYSYMLDALGTFTPEQEACFSM